MCSAQTLALCAVVKKLFPDGRLGKTPLRVPISQGWQSHPACYPMPKTVASYILIALLIAYGRKARLILVTHKSDFSHLQPPKSFPCTRIKTHVTHHDQGQEALHELIPSPTWPSASQALLDHGSLRCSHPSSHSPCRSQLQSRVMSDQLS